MKKQIDSAMLTATGEANAVELKTGDPDVILATRKYVDEAVQKVREQSAPIDSPTFIGTPNAPTTEQDNNSEQLATTAFVQTIGQRYVTPKQGDKRYWKRDENLFPDRQSGYQVLPSGLLLQWGVAEILPGTGDIVKNQVSFPISFPNEVLTIQCTENGTGENRNACNFFLYRKIDNTKFLVRADFVYLRYSFISCSWLALGY